MNMKSFFFMTKPATIQQYRNINSVWSSACGLNKRKVIAQQTKPGIFWYDKIFISHIFSFWDFFVVVVPATFYCDWTALPGSCHLSDQSLTVILHSMATASFKIRLQLPEEIEKQTHFVSYTVFFFTVTKIAKNFTQNCRVNHLTQYSPK